jgi:hypothetical protein
MDGLPQLRDPYHLCDGQMASKMVMAACVARSVASNMAIAGVL